MKFISFLILILPIFQIISCNNEENHKKHFWIELSINKNLNYKDLTVNNIKNNDNETLIKEYLKEKNISEVNFYDFRKNVNTLLIKLPLYISSNELKKFKIELKSNTTTIWQDYAFKNDIFSKENFYQMKDEPCKDKLTDLHINITQNKNNNLKSEYYYTIDYNCKTKINHDKIVIAVNIANNFLNDDPIVKINDIKINNNIKNNYIWNNFTKLLGLDVHYYTEENKTYEENSGYWNITLDKEKVKNYKLIFLSNSGIRTTINLNKIQFCIPPEEKSFEELINEIKALTYGFTLKNGIPELNFRNALDLENNFPNCSKLPGDSSGYNWPTNFLLFDKYGEINLIKFNNENLDYLFTDTEVKLRYYNISNDPDEYKKTGFKRWGLTVSSYFTSQTKDGFFLLIPWHLINEGETLTINSNMIEQQPEKERKFWKALFKPIYFSENNPINFTIDGGPNINYGNYQEITYNFIKIPKKYGDFLELDFHFLAKDGDTILLNYEGKINSRYFGSDIFHCFNKNKLWICPEKGYENNFPWIK